MSNSIHTEAPPTAMPVATAADVFVERIKALLAGQEFLIAQREAARAAEEFPDHSWIERANRVLNPTRVVSVPSTGPDRIREFDWLRRNSGVYRGMWVALLGDDLIAFGKDFGNVLREVRARRLDDKPLVHRID